MRELKPILDGGDPNALTLVPVQLTDESGNGTEQEKFRVPLDDSLRDYLCEHFGLTAVSNTPADSASSDSETNATPNVSGDATSTDNSDDSSDTTDAVDAAASPDGGVEKQKAAEAAPAKPAFEEPKVVLSPREIQDRIRSGKSVDELVEFSGMQRRKIEAFAYPVLAERARIAELGKRSRARRQDGPTKLTLWEILATAFAARGLELADATWDAYRNHVGQWIVAVTWNVGHTTNIAEWSYQAEGSNAISIARNDLAAELIDPDWARRHRDLAPATDDEDGATSETDQSASMPPAWQNNQGNQQRTRAHDVRTAADNQAETAETMIDEDDEEAAFLQHPEHQPHSKRRKKTVMPSWEDVLFGVRPNDRNKQ